jgi:plasmid stabilization system protein ParE
VKAFISKRASRAADRIDERWRKSGDDPGIFAREFLEAVERLETTVGVGASFPTTRHPSLRRLLLPKSRCHVYFEIDETKQTIQILHIWDARRERAPKL